MSDSTRTILVADDEPLARERLGRLVSALPGYRVCAEAGDGREVLSQAAESDPDIVLLDIRMPGMDGLAAAEQLSTLARPPAIIFCTAYDHYAIQAFEVQAVAYLLKPVRREALADALDRAGRVNRVQLRALARQETQDDSQLAIRTHRGTQLIELDKILFCEADQKYVTIHHSDGETVSDYTLKELENAYPEQLMRIHRHTLVGARHIRGLFRDSSNHSYITLAGSPRKLQVSRRHTGAVRQWLREHRPGLGQP